MLCHELGGMTVEEMRARMSNREWLEHAGFLKKRARDQEWEAQKAAARQKARPPRRR